MAEKALILIDVQKCFLPGGTLEVSDSDQVVPVLNRYIELFRRLNLPIYATRDWHPHTTKHFKAYGGLWPEHCVQNTADAEFAADLNMPDDTEIISAGVGHEDQGYSGFEGTNDEGESFDQSLRERGITHLYVGGIATDYCVKVTALDAIRGGYNVTILEDAIKGVDLEEGDSKRAIDEMRQAGAVFCNLERIEEDLHAAVR